jgi:hypothetical protein
LKGKIMSGNPVFRHARAGPHALRVVLEAPYSCRKRPSISAVITFGVLEPWTD